MKEKGERLSPVRCFEGRTGDIEEGRNWKRSEEGRGRESSEERMKANSVEGMRGLREKGTRGSSEKGMRGSSEKGITKNSKEGERGSSDERRRVTEKYSKKETFDTARMETKLMPQVSEAKTPAQDKRATKSQRISNCFVKTRQESDIFISPLEGETLSPMGELSTIAKKYFPRVNRQLLEKTRQPTDARTDQHLQNKSSYKPQFQFLQTLV